MADQTAGMFVILGGIGGILILFSALRPVAGMTVIAFLLLLLSIAWFSVAKGGIHEATAGIFLIGAAICAGLAGVSREIKKLRATPKEHQVDPAVAAYFKNKEQREAA